MLNTRHLHSLCRIASTGSFLATADELNMPASTLSMQMKALETQLGAVLFDRTQRPPSLTPLGRRIAEKARQVVSAEMELVSIASDEDKLTGNWRIGMVATASVRLLPGFLKRAKNAAKNANFQVETALSEVLETRILSGQIDAAIVSGSDLPPKGLAYRLLREEPLVFAFPGKNNTIAFEEVVGSIPFLQFNPGSGIGKQIETYVSDHLQGVGTTIVLDSIESIMECVNEGLGFTLLSLADAERYGRDGVAFHFPKAERPSRKLVLAWAPQTIPEAQIRMLSGLIQEN